MKKIIVFLITLTLLGCANAGRSSNNEIRVEGMYIYFADAAVLFRCDNGQRIFVRGGEANIELERAYAEARSDFGEKVYVDLGGYYKQVDKMDGMGKELVFFVDTIYEVDGEKKCF